MEVNLLAANDPKAYRRFQTLAAAVYPALEKKYPDLSIALVIIICMRLTA
ncbi:MAG: hypothetical protein U5K56_17020 [Halioglobus sp.]|nr:hypothetical protein [Halioglobus sp.]